MMKKVSLLSTILLSASVLLSVGTVADAAVESETTSTNHIIFTPNNHPVDPLDPLDPDEPAPVDPDDHSNHGTDNPGPFSLDYVSNIEFGTYQLEDKTMVYNAKNADPYMQVSDNRGTGAGWTLSAKASAFKTADGKKTLKGAELSFKGATVKTPSDNVSAAPTSKDVTFTNPDYQVVMSATKDHGRGSWLNVYEGTEGNNSKIQLKVLPGTADANVDYTATISWQLTDAPSE